MLEHSVIGIWFRMWIQINFRNQTIHENPSLLQSNYMKLMNNQIITLVNLISPDLHVQIRQCSWPMEKARGQSQGFQDSSHWRKAYHRFWHEVSFLILHPCTSPNTTPNHIPNLSQLITETQKRSHGVKLELNMLLNPLVFSLIRTKLLLIWRHI